MNNFDKCFSKPTQNSLLNFYRDLQKYIFIYNKIRLKSKLLLNVIIKKRDGLMPPMVLSEQYYWQSINTIKNTLETKTNFTDELRARYIEYYNDVGRETVLCGVRFSIITKKN